MTSILGMDVSHWEGKMDFSKAVKLGIQFEYSKASQALWTDDTYLFNHQNAKQNNLKRGAYHFLVWNVDATQQATYFWNLLKNDPGEMPMCVDFEANPGVPTPPTAIRILYNFLETLKRLSGRKSSELAIYTSPGAWQTAVNLAVGADYALAHNTAYWSEYLLWIANPDPVPAPTNLAIWSKWFMWQYSFTGDGFGHGTSSKGVDLDIMTADTWNAYFGAGSGGSTNTNTGNQGDNTSMYETNAKTLYIDSSKKVKDWDKLASEVSGMVFIRAAYVPTWKWTNGVLSGNYIALANIKSDDDYLHEDPDYKSNFTEAKKRGLKVVSVIEFNPVYDVDSNYTGHYQIDQVKNILKAAGNYVGDAFAVQMMQYQWATTTAVITITSSNLVKALGNFLAQLYSEFKQTNFVWTQRNSYSIIRDFNIGTSVYKYESDFTVAFDNHNAGDPSWPLSFTFLPDAWRAAGGPMYTQVASLADAVKVFPSLSSSDINAHMRLGSYSGWLSTNQAGTQSNHSFWGLYGPKVDPAYIATETGTAGWLEPLTFDCDQKTLFAWMLWTAVTPVPNPTPDPNPNPNPNPNPSPIPDDDTAYVTKADFTAYVVQTKALLDGLRADVEALKTGKASADHTHDIGPAK